MSIKHDPETLRLCEMIHCGTGLLIAFGAKLANEWRVKDKIVSNRMRGANFEPILSQLFFLKYSLGTDRIK